MFSSHPQIIIFISQTLMDQSIMQQNPSNANFLYHDHIIELPNQDTLLLKFISRYALWLVEVPIYFQKI